MPFSTLPGLQLAWAVYSGTAAGTASPFIQYNVYRRPDGAADWTRVHVGLTQAGTTWTDYQVSSGSIYEYTVTVSALVAGLELEGEKDATPSEDSVTFTTSHSIFIHNVNDPTAYVELFGETIDHGSEQDVAYVPVWGRQAPIMQVGERQARSIGIRSTPGVVWTQPIWAALRDLQTAQRESGPPLCFRTAYDDGGDLVYVGMNAPRRGDADRQSGDAARSLFQ
jgi:hypothetical protein